MIWTFIASHIWTILGLFGVTSSIGLAIFAFFLGVPMIVAVGKMADALNALIRFFYTPVGQVVGVVALCVLAFLAGDIHRARVEAGLYAKREHKINAEWQAKIDLAAKLFAEQRQAKDDQVKADIDKLVQEKDAEIRSLTERVDVNADKPHPNCVLTPSDLDELRGATRQPDTAKPRKPPKWWDFVPRSRSSDGRLPAPIATGGVSARND